MGGRSIIRASRIWPGLQVFQQQIRDSSVELIFTKIERNSLLTDGTSQCVMCQKRRI